MISPEWQQVKKILAIRLDNVGDAVMLGPSLRTLKESLPQAEITLLASPAGTQVAPMLPWVNEVMTLRATWQDASWQMPLDPQREQNLVEEIRSRHFDAAVIFTSFSQSPYPPAYVCYLAGIPIRLGQSKEFGGSILSQWVKPLPDSTHQVDRNLHLLEEAGFEVTRRDLELRLPQDTEIEATQILQSHNIDPNEPFIVVAPGASCMARRYDPLRFAEASYLLQRETNWPVVIVGSQREMDLVQTILVHTQSLMSGTNAQIVSLAGETSIPVLTAVIKQSSLVLANDSGPMHLADAFYRPMIVLYSGTELEEQWRPRSAPTKLLRRPTSCSPCYAFKCPYNMECLDIPATEVVAQAIELLGISRQLICAKS